MLKYKHKFSKTTSTNPNKPHLNF